MPTTPPQAAQLLTAARTGGPAVPWRDILPADRAGAYAIQDATLAAAGPIAGWKVGAKSPARRATLRTAARLGHPHLWCHLDRSRLAMALR